MAPSRSRDISRVIAITGMAVLITAACNGSAPTPASRSSPELEPTLTPAAVATTEPTPATTPTPEPTPEATASAAASADANTFVSTRYKYALTLPPGTTKLGWHSAERAWNGQAMWEMGGPYEDRNLIAEGGLFLLGVETPGLDDLFNAIEKNGTNYHRCTKAQNRRDATVGGVAVIGFTQECLGAYFARVVIVKDGHGIAMMVNTPPGSEIAGRDKAIELLEGLHWRTE
jgi:hypothetical protein